MGTFFRLSLGLGAACLLAGSATADPVRIASPWTDMPKRFYVAAGESVRHAILRAESESRAAEIRQEWLASGHKPTAFNSPTLVSGSLSGSPDVSKAPDDISLQVKFTTDAPGLASVSACFNSATSAQILCEYYYGTYGAPPLTNGSLTMAYPNTFGHYAAAGTWTLNSVEIIDNAGGYADYDQSQLASLFPSLNFKLINKAASDTAAPMVTTGSILNAKKTVHLSKLPSFGAELGVSDNRSGVNNAYVTVCPPANSGGYCVSAAVEPASPVTTGKVDAWGNLGSTAPTGTWTIDDYSICDWAGNCTFDDTQADIQSLFGTTTFKVTTN